MSAILYIDEIARTQVCCISMKGQFFFRLSKFIEI